MKNSPKGKSKHSFMNMIKIDTYNSWFYNNQECKMFRGKDF